MTTTTTAAAAASSSSIVDDHHFCFLEVSIAGQAPQRIVLELFRETCPQTCQNFATLCAAPGRTCTSKPIPAFRGSIFHRIVPQFMVQGGDFEHFNGTGGHAVLTSTRTFADESFVIPHDKAGLLSMANKGKNTNGSQFFITLASTPHLNGKHVVFGQVVEGMDVVHKMATDVELEGTKPTAMQKIIIVDCGMGKGGTNSSSSSSSSDDESISDRKKHRKHNKEKKKKKLKDEKRKSHKAKKRKKKHSREEHRKKKSRRHSYHSKDSTKSSDESTPSSERDRKQERKKSKDDDPKPKRKKSHSSSSKRRRQQKEEQDPSSSSSRSMSSDKDDSRKRKSHKKHHPRREWRKEWMTGTPSINARGVL